MSTQFFDESILIRKQREEIVLLTNELKNQELNLNVYNDENTKLKCTIKVYEKKLEDTDKHMKIYENQIKDLKCQLDEKNHEIELIKGKLNNKEVFFNKKLIKLTQCEYTVEKLTKELTNESTAVKDLKNENSKILLKLGEQSNRYKEVKFKNDELIKTIETKNNLLDVAKTQIVNLETKLNSFIKLFNSLKNEGKLNNSFENIHSNEQQKLSKNETTPNSSAVTWNSCSYDEKKMNNPNYLINLINEILSKKHDNKLNNFLQSLKEHWFETNVICEQIKGYLIAKYPKKLNNERNESKIVNYSNTITNERLTSTPVHF